MNRLAIIEPALNANGGGRKTEGATSVLQCKADSYGMTHPTL
jgi:hypothetical protein